MDDPGNASAELEKSWLQKMLDNPWLLLVLGIVIPVLSYTVWGLVEWMNLAEAPLP